MRDYIEILELKADKRRVFDLLDELRLARRPAAPSQDTDRGPARGEA